MARASIAERVEALTDRLIEWRRHLHAHPELSFEEQETSRWIGERLTELGLPWQRIQGTTSIVAWSDGPQPGRTVALRADIDALPIEEQAEVPFRSRIPGRMHACGHDGHTAMLLGVAALLAESHQAPGRVKLIFQAAEERPPGGAHEIVRAGVLAGVDRVFGLHLTTALPTGTASLREGTAMANVDRFRLTIRGRGGHAARPHETVDALHLAAQTVTNLQSVVSRHVHPLSPAVLTIGFLQAGTAFNIIAGEATMEGTVRTLDAETRQRVRETVERLVSGLCNAYGADWELDYQFGYPALRNDPESTALLRKVAAGVLGEERIERLPPVMAGDDMAVYLQVVPGAYLQLGCRNEEIGAVYPNHHPKFTIDERALPLGTRILYEAALADRLPGWDAGRGQGDGQSH